MKSGVCAFVLATAVAVSGCSKSSNSGNPAAPSQTPAPTPGQRTVSSVAISGTTSFTGVGQTSQLAAIATFSDNATQNVTTDSVWQTSNPAVATVSGTGMLTTVGFGVAEVSVAYQGVRGVATVNVSGGPTPTCAATLSETAVTFEAGAGSRTVDVRAADASCTWTASSDSSWIVITGGVTGRGSGTVSYSVLSNTTGQERTGRITAAGQVLTIRQTASPRGGGCPDPNGPTFQVCVAPESRTVSAAGGSFTLSVTTSRPDLQWNARTNQSWVRVSTATRTGNGSVTYVVDPNPFGFERVATVIVQGISRLNPPAEHTVTQRP